MSWVIDITGQKFNRLTALEFSHKIPFGNARGFSHFWKFKCDCGKVITRRKDTVKKGIKDPTKGCKSCGCLNVEKAESKRFSDYDFILNRAYGDHKNDAKKRGYVTHLSKKQYEKIASKKCFYCGSFSTRKRTRIRNGKTTVRLAQINSVDRFNNEPFYKISNSVSGCLICQAMKRDMKSEDFLNHADRISIFRSNL